VTAHNAGYGRGDYLPLMPLSRSPEIESVVRRTLGAYTGDFESLRNLMSSDPSLRVLGFDRDEWWKGPAEFFGVRETQVDESPDFEYRLDEIEGFADGEFGWATIFATLATPEASTQLRHTAVLRVEAGVWKVIQLHNSSPVANQQVFGVDLTKTLSDLVASILDDENRISVGSAAEGTMTLVFTDVVDSTPLTESIGDSAWAGVIGTHESTIRRITAAEGGAVVDFIGDGSMLAFESARAAVRAAVQIQKETVDAQFDVRIGIHTGEVLRTADGFFGLTVNKAARVTAASPAAGIMLSSTTKDMVGSMDHLRFGEPQIVALKGLSGTHQIVPIDWE